jgi:hypothetical protein
MTLMSLTNHYFLMFRLILKNLMFRLTLKNLKYLMNHYFLKFH